MILPALAALAMAAGAAPPAQLLARAGRGRAEFLRTVAELERFAPRLPRKEELFPYLELLEPLNRLQRGYGLDRLGLDPVKELGADLTNEAEKWLRLDRDPPGVVESFLKWATLDTRIIAAGDSAILAAEAGSARDLLAWQEGIRFASDVLREAKAQRPALRAFEELQGIVTHALLARRKELSPAELDRAVERALSAPAIEELLLFLDEATAAAQDAQDRARLLGWAVTLGENARRLGPGAPLRLRSDAAQGAVEALSRALVRGDAPDPASLERLLDLLAPAQAEDLAARLVELYAGGNVPPAQKGYVRKLAGRMEERFDFLRASGRWRAFQGLQERL